MKEKTPLMHYLACFQMHNKKALAEVCYYLSENLPLSQKLCYFKGSSSHNALYYQQLSIARYQVSFYANNYFE